MAVYFSSFYPLCCTDAGRTAVLKYGLPPFIDGSCRREPDFEHPFPALTGLCRPGFSAKLKKGEIVIYTSNIKGVGRKYLVAVLKVIETKEGHINAANWYKTKGYDLPNNLMVPGNNAIALDHTHRMMGWGTWAKDAHDLKSWDSFYKTRAKDDTVAICEPWNGKVNVNSLQFFTSADVKRIFKQKKMPGTRNPAKLKDEDWNRLKDWII